MFKQRSAHRCTWSGFGALAGSWIGGTGNLAAVASSLETPGEMVGIVVLVDNFVYILYFPIILTSKRWASRLQPLHPGLPGADRSHRPGHLRGGEEELMKSTSGIS